MIVEHSFGVWIVRICCIVFELCLIKKKKEERKKREERRKKEERRRTKSKSSRSIFSIVRRSHGTPGIYFT